TAGGLCFYGVCRGVGHLRRELSGPLSPRRDLRGQDLQGHAARGFARRAPHEVRTGHQPQDRQGPRPEDPAVAPAAGGPGDRLVDRRAFIGTLTGGLLAVPLAAAAQTVGRAPRIGLLMPGHPPFDAPATHGFRQGLGGLGYVEGRTLAIEYRAAEGKPERYPELVADLLRVPVDLIVPFSVAALPALTRATKDVPVVLATLSDPVREGYAKSFARPGGNITGLTLVNDEFLAKRLQILKEAVSGTTRVALVRNPRPGAGHADIYRAAGAKLGVTIEVFDARKAIELDRVSPLLARSGIRAVILAQDPLFGAERKRLAELG